MNVSKNAYDLILRYEKLNKTGLKEIKEYARQLEKVLNAIEISINQNSFDALVSVVYSIGMRAFMRSEVFDLLEKHSSLEEVANAIKRLNQVTLGGTVQRNRCSKSLTERRQSEKALFLRPEYRSDL